MAFKQPVQMCIRSTTKRRQDDAVIFFLLLRQKAVYDWAGNPEGIFAYPQQHSHRLRRVVRVLL